MKWIKTAIEALIAVLTIGIIATSVYKMTQPSKVIREVSFEIDYVEKKYYPLSAYNEIVEYGVIDVNNNNIVINLVSLYINDEISDQVNVLIPPDSIWLVGDLPDLSGRISGYIDADGNWGNYAGVLNSDVSIKLVFEVPQSPQFTGSSAILILLIPTVYAGGVLLYFYKPFKKWRLA